MAYSDVVLLLALALTVALAYPTKDDESFYNRLHEIPDSYGKEVRNLDGIDSGDEARPLFNLLRKTQQTEDTEKGPFLRFSFGSDSHLDGIGGGHLVRDFELEQGLMPSDLNVLMQSRAFMETPQTFGFIRNYPTQTKNSLTSEESIKTLLQNPEEAAIVFNCLFQERCKDGFFKEYVTEAFPNNGLENEILRYPAVVRRMHDLGVQYFNSERPFGKIGGSNLLNINKQINSLGRKGNIESCMKYLDPNKPFYRSDYETDSDAIGKEGISNYEKDLDSIGGGHLLNYKKYLDSIGGGHLLNYKKELGSIGGGNILTYKKSLDSIGGGHLLNYKKDLDSIGGGHLLNYKKELDSIGGGNFLTYKKSLDSIGGGHLLNYKKDLDSIGGGHLLNHKKSLDSIGGGHLLNYKKDLDSIGGGHLLNHKKSLDSIGGGHLLNYKKDLDLIGGGHLLNHKKSLDSIGGGHLLNYKKDLDSIGGGNLLSYTKSLDSIGGGHLLNYKKDLDSMGEENLKFHKESLDSIGVENLLNYNKNVDSTEGGYLLNLKRNPHYDATGYSLYSIKDIDSPLRKPSITIPLVSYQKYYRGTGLPVKSSRALCPSSRWFLNQLSSYLAKEESKNKFKSSKTHNINWFEEEKGGGNLLRDLDMLRNRAAYLSRDQRPQGYLEPLLGNKRSGCCDSLSGIGIGNQKRNMDEIDRSSFNSFIKKNFDEIDRSGFGSFVKRNFDEIDRSGFGSFVKRSATPAVAPAEAAHN